MTEQEWLRCPHPGPLLSFLRGRASDRKLRLFAVACVRPFWPLLLNESSRAAVRLAERVADGEADRAELAPAWHEAWSVLAPRKHVHVSAALAAARTVAASPYAAADRVKNAIIALYAEEREGASENEGLYLMGRCEGEDVLLGLLHEIFGNPFRAPAVDPAWLAWADRTVVTLARSIYEERAFDRMPILGDALEEAGCADDALLAHCRGPGPHVRGCWVIDLVLGKG